MSSETPDQTLELFDKLELKITTATSTIADLQKQVTHLTQDHNNLQKSQKDSEQFMIEIIALEESKKTFETSLNLQQERNDQLQQELVLLKQKHSGLNESYGLLQEDHELLKQKLTTLTQLTQSNGILQNEAEQYKSEIRALTEANAILQEEKIQLKENQQHWQQRVQTVIQKMGQLESQLELNKLSTSETTTNQTAPDNNATQGLSFSNSYHNQREQRNNN